MSTTLNKLSVPSQNGSGNHLAVGAMAQQVDNLLDGATTLSFSGGNVTINDTETASNTARYGTWVCSGLTANRELLAPSRRWSRYVSNTSAFDVKVVLVFAGSGVTIPAGETRRVICDGSAVAFPDGAAGGGGSTTLAALTDVDLSGTTGGQVLKYNSSTGKWENGTDDTASGGTGEANTASNLGGGSGLYAAKSGVDLQFKSLVAGSGVSLNVTSTEIEISASGGGGGGSSADYIQLRDEKASGTAGGNFTSGAWRTRTLNTEAQDTGNHCTLSSNQFTLAAGTYEIEAWGAAYGVNVNQMRLYNISDSTVTLLGQTVPAQNNGASPNGQVKGRFTITGSKTFELQHRCTTTSNTTGFGIAASFGNTEVYAEVILRKVA